jgi:hypothetical protein
LNVAGLYAVLVQRESTGYATKNIQFTYNLAVSSVSAIEGSFGGGLEITLSGSGFAGSNTSITICNNACVVTSSTSASQVSCKVKLTEIILSVFFRIKFFFRYQRQHIRIQTLVVH